MLNCYEICQKKLFTVKLYRNINLSCFLKSTAQECNIWYVYDLLKRGQMFGYYHCDLHATFSLVSIQFVIILLVCWYTAVVEINALLPP